MKFSIDEWLRLSQQGIEIPLIITLKGHSMEPLIRYNKDLITIMPQKREVQPGDIILFKREDGAYVVHRIRSIKEEYVSTIGDNCIHPDKDIPIINVLGIVTSVKRGHFRINLDTVRQRRYGIRWMKYYRYLWLYWRRISEMTKSCISRLLRKISD